MIESPTADGKGKMVVFGKSKLKHLSKVEILEGTLEYIDEMEQINAALKKRVELLEGLLARRLVGGGADASAGVGSGWE